MIKKKSQPYQPLPPSSKQQNQLIPNSAWKDYSSNTNYAFDNFESDTHKSQHSSKHHRSDRSGGYSNGNSQQTTLQMSHSPNKAQYYEIDRTDGMHRNGGGDPRWVKFYGFLIFEKSMIVSSGFSCRLRDIVS